MKLFGYNITRDKPPKEKPSQKNSEAEISNSKSTVPPTGRVSVPNDPTVVLSAINSQVGMVTPSFRSEVIPLIRKLYKVNSDMSITIQDMFKLTNTGHQISFPHNTDKESDAMEMHLKDATKDWTMYTAGIDGLINKFIVQCLVSGAISIEGVPKNDLSGISTVLFINPEDIMFKRTNDGTYLPYQINKTFGSNVNKTHIKLNTITYKYIGMYNDTDEPYGIPPFMAALESLATQKDMKINFKQMMDLAGLMGFLEALVEKPSREGGESIKAYESRLNRYLTTVKKNMINGIKDGLVVGYQEDHSFKMNSTSKDLSNLDKVWNMNQQSVANGLGGSGSLIGVQNANTEGGAGILLSKMISQLKNIQTLVISTLEFLYLLELRLAGFNCKGIKIKFNSSTITDEVKIQQGLEYKIRNLEALYDRGIISQEIFANEMGYLKPDKPEPRVSIEDPDDLDDAAKKKKRETDKDTSDRRSRDKVKVNPKRKDHSTKPQ
jgi:hypothetical protein